MLLCINSNEIAFGDLTLTLLDIKGGYQNGNN